MLRYWTVGVVAAIGAACMLSCASECAAKDGPAKPGYWEVSDAAGLTRAAAKMARAGGTIMLKPGIYIIDQTLHFSKLNGINIVGTGWNTGIQKRGAGDVIVFEDCGFSTVRNLLINGDGSAKEGSGIVFKGQSSSCRVDFCRISNCPESGILFDGNPKAPQSSSVVSNCHFIDNHGDQLRSYYNNDFSIIGNQFGAHQRVNALAPRSGCALDHSSAGVYTRNFHWENRVALRMGPGANFNRIENNRFEMSRETGIIIGDPKGDGNYLNIIIGNTIHTNSEEKPGVFPAVEAYNTVDTTFCSNQVFSWNATDYKHKNSLLIGSGCKSWIVKDNIFRNNTEKPLVYDEGAGHIVKDNLESQ